MILMQTHFVGVTSRWHLDHQDQEGGQHRQDVGVNFIRNDW